MEAQRTSCDFGRPGTRRPPRPGRGAGDARGRVAGHVGPLGASASCGRTSAPISAMGRGRDVVDVQVDGSAPARRSRVRSPHSHRGRTDPALTPSARADHRQPGATPRRVAPHATAHPPRAGRAVGSIRGRPARTARSARQLGPSRARAPLNSRRTGRRGRRAIGPVPTTITGGTGPESRAAVYVSPRCMLAVTSRPRRTASAIPVRISLLARRSKRSRHEAGNGSRTRRARAVPDGAQAPHAPAAHRVNRGDAAASRPRRGRATQASPPSRTLGYPWHPAQRAPALGGHLGARSWDRRPQVVD